MLLSVEEDRIVHVAGDPNHPANHGRLCTKGLTVHHSINVDTRLTQALTRPSRSGDFQPAQMGETLKQVAEKLQSIIKKHGKDSVAMYVSGQMSTEAQYLANKLCKGLIGTNNIDSNSRLCMASAASGYKTSLGADAPPGCYEDIEHANLFFVIGSNMADCHPILFIRMMDQIKKTGAKLIVVDPRRTATAEKASLFMPIKPGTDLCLLNGIMHLLIQNNWIDHEFIQNNTEQWDELKRHVTTFTPEHVSQRTGLPVEDLYTVANWISESKQWMSIWTMGLNQSTKGTAQTNAICNLHLATGAIGIPGAGPFSLTGQPNAMGGREVGYLSHALPGQRVVANQEHRKVMEEIWGLDEGTISPQPGLDTVAMFKALEEKNLKAIWIIATNPVASVANRKHVIAGLENAELVIVQDAYHPTETTAYADILLPGAVWAEGEGTMVNSERCVTLMQQAVDPPGDAMPDWKIIAIVAQHMGYQDSFSYNTADEVFDEIKRTRNPKTQYVLDAIHYEKLRGQSIKWPSYEGMENISRRYLLDQPGIMNFATENGKAKFWAHDDKFSVNESNNDYPLILTNGRLPHQWHTRTKTGAIETLNRLNPSPFLQLHPSNAERLGIQNGDLVEVESKNGKAMYPAKIEDRISPDVCFAPFHWNDGNYAINQATADECDPISLQPEFKLNAVKLTKLESNPQQGNNTMIAQASTTNDAFTNEQKEFLEGLMAGSRVQGLSLPGTDSGDGSGSAEPDHVFGTPIEDLSKEEKVKLEQNGLDVWGKMVHHAEENKFPEGGDVFRFKYHGMFYVAPAQEAYMLRCRIPAGILTTSQMRGLAYIAEQWGGNYASVTTRANIQIREFKAKNLINVLTKLYDIGLTSKGSGADNIRNVTASPTSGIDPDEIYDVRSLAKAMHHYILNHRDLYGLPRKFNISFESGGAISVVSDTNDIAFVAVRVGEGHEVEPGVYFRVELGGITGHGDFARDSGILIHPSQCIPVAVAILRVFIENGDRTNRKKARMKYILDRWGIEKFIEEVQKKLPFDLTHFPVENCQAQRHTTRHGHIGIFKQSQPKLNYVGVAIPVGQMTVKQMRIIAETAEAYGSGEIRLTVWQNLIIPNIHEDNIPAVERAIKSAGLDTKASSVMGGLIACTGNAGCKFASTSTKSQAVDIARYLEKKVDLDQPINIHLTGCPHSCAQHYCGDIGLLGVKVTDNGEQVEGYNISFGGGVDQDQGIAKEVFKGIPHCKVPKLLEQVLKVYKEKRNNGESFVSFTRRHEVKELQELFSN